MAVFSQADDEAVALLTRATEKWHPELKEVGVRVGLRFAHAKKDEETGEPKGPALTHGGYPAKALVRVVPQKDRVAGMPDAMIDLDADHWPDLPEEKRLALLDHELEHLELVKDFDGSVVLDDCCRPKLRLKKHDFCAEGFWNCVERHKESAAETNSYKDVHKKFTQLLFPWG